MPIQFVCPGCNKQHKAPPEFAGRQARCSCGAVLVVPALASPPPTATPPGFAGVPPAAAPHASSVPTSAVAGPTDPAPWGFESVKPAKPAVKLAPLTKFLADQRKLVVGVGAGIGAIVLLALILWMFLGRSGISEATRYLPNDCLIVGTSNVDELLRSSIYQQMKKDLPNVEAGERKMEQDMGIAPANISRITFAVGGKLNTPDDADAVVIIRLKKAVAAADLQSTKKDDAFRKDFKYEEVKIGSITAFEERYRFAFGDAKAERMHGEAFCLPESTLVVICPKLETLKKILERGKSPQFSEEMQNALNETNFSKTLALAVNVKGLAGNLPPGSLPNAEALKEFTENVLGLAVDASLDSSKATVNATILCKDAKHAEDVKKILDAAQVAMRSYAKKAPGMPSEAADTIDAVKFSLSGANVKGSMQASLEPLSKWIKEQAGQTKPVTGRVETKSGAARTARPKGSAAPTGADFDPFEK